MKCSSKTKKTLCKQGELNDFIAYNSIYSLISKPNPKETNEKMQNFQNQTKNLTKHPFNKRFSVGAVLERNFKEENPLKSKDLNQTNPINPQNFEKANNLDEFNKILEEFEEDEKNIPAQLSKSSEVIQEEITKRKSVTSNFSANFNKAEQNIPENEVYPDPLEKYRAVKKTFQKNFEEPKEIWQNPNKRRNILILVVLILFSLVLCNLFLANKKKIDIQQENNSNSSISQESKHEKHQTNFDQIQVNIINFNLYIF